MRCILDWALAAISALQDQLSLFLPDSSSVRLGILGWTWPTPVGPLLVDELTSKATYYLLQTNTCNSKNLNSRWLVTHSVDTWRRRWKRIWHFDLLFRNKIFLWRVFSGGLFTMRKTCIIKRSDGICTRCWVGEETLSHLFFECPLAVRTRQLVL